MTDLFDEITQAVLDLQGAELQTYQRPLKQLGKLLRSSDFAAANQFLQEGLDLDAFLEDSGATGGSMVGSKQLQWPDDRNQELGLTLLLIDRLADSPEYAIDFAHDYFYSQSRSIMSGIHSMVRQLIIPFVRDYKKFVLQGGQDEPRIMMPKGNKVFIVHGHDGEARESVARFLSQLGLDPVILHEQANQGRTDIEKVEAHSDVGFAVVLLTPDDEGRARGVATFEARARQNVLLELGFFIGKLGRRNVCALKRGVLEIPSDFAGVVWTMMDATGGWRQALGKELQASGYSIDWNLVMGASRPP